ncbi:ribonuclease Z [Enterococcus saccharolyticus]|uniref:Metallo-beta-lactamase domain-containing protein n=1 Tax=Candidatus Enterococcus willemsii TaxID=1857215 RepID=A0ABQ6YVD0_9ENTE|nr:MULTISPECIES: MBL fold metallo-hydrolase [Enterococcus]KAF1301044.1 hypothetical protein BAU17_09480 [Enterococcus sp. CU12B]MCD5001149.1 ribonuclease Z [Enterococcus saccharolyticus]
MFNFLGSGSGFNTALGNNNAYIKKGTTLFMIDCGSTAFSTLKKYQLFDGIEHIYVLLTHLHADHVGSLGDLIFYGKYALGEMGVPNVTVLCPKEIKVADLLTLMGIPQSDYALEIFDQSSEIQTSDLQLSFTAVPVEHVPYLDCFGYIFNYQNQTAYYSGDSMMIPEKILTQIHQQAFDFFYQDTSQADYPGNIHLSLGKLTELIAPEYRSRVYCMHLDEGFNKESAKKLGFQVIHSIQN